jgi:hypothetical protein
MHKISFATLLPSSDAHLSVARRLKHDRDAATSASRTHQSRFQPRQWEVRPARANQWVEVELLPIDALPNGFRALAIAIGAPHVHLPADASRYAQGLHFHENESGTSGGSSQVSLAAFQFHAESDGGHLDPAARFDLSDRRPLARIGSEGNYR